MQKLRILFLRIITLFKRRHLDAELDEELQAHIALAIEDNVRRGMTRQQARTAALRSFGGVSQIRDAYREQRGFAFFESFLQDLKFGTRTLLRSWGFAVVALLTLTLGIGATTAIFSIVDAVLLRPLPYSDPGQLVTIHEDMNGIGFPRASVSPRTYLDLRARRDLFEDVAATNETSYNLSNGAGAAQLLSGILATHNLFSMLGVRPILGRLFLPEEDQPGRDHELLLSYGLWRTQFAGNPLIVGRSIRLNDELYTIVGVMPKGFSFPKENFTVEVWAPKAFTATEINSHNMRYLTVAARLRPGVTVSTANAVLQVLSRRREIFALIAGHGMRLTCMGVGLGLTGALLLTRLIASLLFGVGSSDPVVFRGVALILLLVGSAASYLPARRAMRVDPMQALRAE
jgi:MacB-like periplasmic core domain